MAKLQQECLRVSIRVRPPLNFEERILAEKGDVEVQGNEIVIKPPRTPGRGNFDRGHNDLRSSSLRISGTESEGGRLGRVGSLTTQLLSRSGLSKDSFSNPQHSFTFGHVFTTDASSQDVYIQSGAEDIVRSVCEGCNGTVFVYGQTGTGKTFTIDGITESAVRQVFGYVEKLMSSTTKATTVFLSVLELYNDLVRDLLGDREGLKMASPGNSSAPTYVIGLLEEAVDDEATVLKRVAKAKESRIEASTKANERSSRGHLIVRFKIETIETVVTGSQRATFSTLNLVDLAGSERAEKAGTADNSLRFKESTHINKDLLMLGNVVTSLADRSLHVPYRDSKLTRLLQDSLGGNARTCLIACITTLGDWHQEQTRHTLDFAARAARIVCEPRVNVAKLSGNHASQLTALQFEIETLRRQLATQTAELDLHRSKVDSETLCLDAKVSIVPRAASVRKNDSEDVQERTCDPGSWLAHPLPGLLSSPRLASGPGSAINSGTAPSDSVLQELIALLERKRSEVSLLRDRLDTFQNQHRTLETERSTNQQQVADLRSALETMSERREELERDFLGEMSKVSSRLTLLESENNELKLQLSKSGELLEVEQAKVALLATTASERDTLKKEVDALKTQMAQSQQETATYRGEIEILQAQLRQSGGRVEESVERLKARLGAVGTLHTHVAVKDSVLHSQQNLMGDMSRRIHELQQALAQANAEKEVLGKKLELSSAAGSSNAISVAAIKAMRRSRDNFSGLMASADISMAHAGSACPPAMDSRLWSTELPSGANSSTLVMKCLELTSQLEKQADAGEKLASMASGLSQLQALHRELADMAQNGSTGASGPLLLPMPPSKPEAVVSDLDAKAASDDDFEIGFDPETEQDVEKTRLWNRLRHLKAQNTMLRNTVCAKDHDLVLKADADARLHREMAELSSELVSAHKQVDALLDAMEGQGVSGQAGSSGASALSTEQLGDKVRSLWRDLDVPLGHRTTLTLPGKDGQTMLATRSCALAELQRLEWLQQQYRADGAVRATARVGLQQERTSLVASLKAVPKPTMAAHYTALGIALKSKRRKEQLAAVVWGEGVSPDASAKAVAMAKPVRTLDVQAFYAMATTRLRLR